MEGDGHKLTERENSQGVSEEMQKLEPIQSKQNGAKKEKRGK